MFFKNPISNNRCFLQTYDGIVRVNGKKPVPELAKHEFTGANNFSTEDTTFTAADLYNLNTTEIPYLVCPIIPAIGIWALVGSSDTGKSMLLRQLVLDLAKKKNFLAWTIKGRCYKALFIATEDDSISTSFLLRKQSSSIDYLENIRFHFATENIEDFLNRELEKEPVDLIIIDAWSDVFGQNLTDSYLIRQTLNKYRSIANKYKCSIGFLHHTGKRTEKLEPSKNNILSGQGFEAKMRLVMELRADAANENIRHLCIVKGNYLGKEFKQSSFVLDFNTDTFQFTYTGQRVPFEQLATPSAEQEKKKKNTPFHEINEDVHRELVRSIFKTEPQQKYAELWKLLGNAYEKKMNEIFGRDRSQKLLTFLVNGGYIIKKGNKSGKRDSHMYSEAF